MSSNFCVIAATLFLCGSCYAQSPTSEVQVPPITNTNIANTNSPLKLEDATPVMLRTKQDLSSAKAKAGDRVPFRVVKDVKAGDLIVIRRGADAWGIVTAVQHKRRKGRPGNLDVAIQSVQILTGENAALRAQQHSQGQSRDVTIGPRDIIDSAVFFGVTIPFMLGSMLEKGEDAHVPAGTKFTAYLNGDVALDRIALELIQPAPVQRKGPAIVTIFAATAIGARPPSSFWTALGSHPPVYCGKVALAKLPAFAYLKIQLPPGKYFFRSEDKPVVEVSLEEGQELYLQMQMVALKRGLKGRLVQVDNEDGEEGIAHLRQLADKDVTIVSDANLAELKAPPELE
jgi:hypothetical protein